MEIVKSYSNYLIDEQGNVFSKLKKRLLKPHDNNGYKMVFLKGDNGFSKWQYVHRIVANQFITIPDKTGELWVNHKDGNKSNNNVNNLEWTTISENITHAHKKGLRKSTKGELHHSYNKPNNSQKWIYCFPTGERLTHYELKNYTDYKTIIVKCWKNKDGYKRERK
jgi:hypothetical protein